MKKDVRREMWQQKVPNDFVEKKVTKNFKLIKMMLSRIAPVSRKFFSCFFLHVN